MAVLFPRVSLSRPFLQSLALGSLTVLLLVLSFPLLSDPRCPWLIWMAFVPLLYLLETGSVVRSGLAFGLVGLFTGVILSLWAIRFTPVVSSIGLLAIFAEAFTAGFLYRWVGGRLPWTRGFLLAFVFPCLEHARELGYFGFAVGQVGSVLYRSPLLIQGAEFGGVYALTFLVILINLGITQALHRRFLPLAAALVLLGLNLAYGFYKVSVGNRSGAPISVLLVQTQTKVRSVTDLKPLLDLTRKGLAFAPHLVIWPEVAIQQFSDERKRIVERVRTFVRENRVPILAGVLEKEIGQKGRVRRYNTVTLFAPKGQAESVYRKRHLVPGWESPIWPGRPSAPNRSPYLDPGQGVTLHEIQGRKFGTLVCFEGNYESLTRELVRAGASFLVVVSSDRWAPSRSEIYQASSLPIFRAVEFRRDLLRCGDVGISFVADARGRVLRKSEPYRETLMVVEVHPSDGMTFYALHGNVFVLGCLLVTLGAVALAGFTKGTSETAPGSFA